MSYGYSIRLVKLNKEADRKLLGVRLGRQCIKLGIPVAEVARYLGVSRQTIYNWFMGATMPRATQSEAIKNFINQNNFVINLT
jgi:transcriptional regulator with XRE-family HTH domain